MIPEIGVFCLVLALLVALVQGTLALAGAHWGVTSWMRVARRAALGQFLFASLAMGCLAWSFFDNDFSVLYVAANSHVALPTPYRLAALWGGHEGSMLLWLHLLAGWTLAVARFSRQLPEAFVARVLGVMACLSVGFLLFVLFLSNPFSRLMPPAVEGRDLNPLLQDPGMVVHPPVLYMGYVGFSVAFAFAIAALLSGRLDSAWARWSRPWTVAAWSMLTLGILLGSAWAYYVLGWGGWWFWDPVENASFMPWLLGTALIHSLAVTDKRGAFRSWTVLLAICTFALCLVGTFLVRSGVLTSVHAFAVDPGRGLFILSFLVLVVGSSLLLFAWRAPRVGMGGSFGLVSRESLLLFNNLVLTVAGVSVLTGTLYPLALDVLGGEKISVGPPYFEAVFVPLMAPGIFLMGVGPMAHWKGTTVPELALRLRWAFAAGVLAALAFPWVAPTGTRSWSPLIGLGVLLAAWAVASAFAHACQRLSAGPGGWLERARRQPLAWYGMLLAHAGVGVFILGVTLANGYESRQELRLELGERATLAGYEFAFEGIGPATGPNYDVQRATIDVNHGGIHVTTLHPEKRLYRVQQMPMSQAAIDTGFGRDLFVAMGEPAGERAWTLRLQVKPLMTWIWAGCVLMAIGGFLAVADRRYRLARSASAVAVASELARPATTVIARREQA
jgi:cytochrome c-type biogenesis protein CcmF